MFSRGIGIAEKGYERLHKDAGELDEVEIAFLLGFICALREIGIFRPAEIEMFFLKIRRDKNIRLESLLDT